MALTHLQQPPLQLADLLLEEAQRIAPQLQSFSDAGWVMQLLCVSMSRNPGSASRFMPMLKALDTAVRQENEPDWACR